MFEELACQAGLTPEQADEVEVLYEFPDRATLEDALLAIAPVYRFENRFRYLIATVP